MAESMRQPEYLHAIYTPQPPSSYLVDIVFVHGLNPNSKPDFAISTWTHEQGNFWPEAQLPLSIPSARILLFSYNSQVAWDVSINGIQQHANNLLDRLSGARPRPPQGSYTAPIIFVAHSLGGLIVKQALVTAKNNDAYKDIRDATYGLVFFAVPHQGGHGATLGAIVKNIVVSLTGDGRNDLVESLRKNSLFLENQSNLFKYQFEDYHIVSIFEDRPTKFTGIFGRLTNLIIVDETSATLGLAGTREKLLTVDSNHSDVCKFEGDDDKFEPIKRAIGKLARDATEKEKRAAAERAQISPGPPVESLRRVKERKLCPFPVASFTGRNNILRKMHKYFGDSDGKIQRVFVLYGLGGSGKSQLAFKFLEESRAKNRFSDIFYIDASKKQTLEMDLESITPRNVEQSADASLRWLANQHDGHWLLFFDNADDIHLTLNEFFPPRAFGNILVTTRNRELRSYAATKDSEQNVTGMDHKDAINLLLRLSQAGETDENKVLAAQIVQELHYFALAVSQAGAFIRCHSSLSNYRELYQPERDNLLQNKEVQGSDPYGKAVYTTWRLSYDKLDAPARSFLQICSMLHHEGISEEMFKKAALSESLDQLEDSELQNEVTKLLNLLGKLEHDSGWSSWCFLQTTKQLGSYSLIEYDDQNCTYSLHPLVQHWSGTTIGENRHLMKKCVLSIIGLSISWTFTTEDYKYRSALLKHIINSTTSLNPTEIDPFVASRFARTYFEQGHWSNAEALQMVVMVKVKQVKGVDHSSTLASMTSLADTYRKQGRWKDAEMLEVVVILERRKQWIQRDDHPHILTNMANLAVIYRNQGHWKEAEVLQVVVIEKRKQLLGDDHHDTLTIMGSLAATYRNQGRWKDAEILQMKVMEKMKWLLGDNHPDTLTSMVNLAVIYRNQGCLKNAEVLEVIVMQKRKWMLGDDHPDTLTSMGNLAETYRKLGRWKDAEQLEVVVLEKMKQVLGDDHPGTLTSMGNLAATYRKQGHWKDAEILEVKVMEKMKQVMGDDHPNTLTSMANLAFTYWNQSRWKDAELLEVQVMQKRKLILGDDHPDTITIMGNLAATYQEQGCWKEAEELEILVMEKRKQLLGDDHLDTLTIMGNLAATYRNQGRWKDAEVLEVKVMEKMQQALGDDHPDTLTSMGNLADTYRNQGRWKDAELLEVVVMEKMKRVQGDDHPNTLTSMSNLALTYWNQDCLQDAEMLEVKVMEKLKQILGDDHLNTLLSTANLATIYQKQGRWKDAEMLQVVVVKKLIQLLGDDHPDTLTSMSNLALTYWKQGCWQDAEILLVKVIENSKQVLGDDH